MTLIDETYFTGELNLPQVANRYQQDSIEKTIETYEAEFLKAALGYELATLLQAAWDAANPEPPGVPVLLEPRFDALINGSEFTFEFNGKTIFTEWKGFVNDEKDSVIAYYVYYQYRNYKETRVTTTGEAKVKKENAKVVSPYWRMQTAWNNMVKRYGVTPKARYFNRRKNSEVKEIFLEQSNYKHTDFEPTMYNFLLANIGDYPEWIFEPKYKRHFI